MSDTTDPTTLDLLAYIAAGPTPRHCVGESARRLKGAGFVRLEAGDVWSLEHGQGYWLEDRGTILGFRVGTAPVTEAGFRVLGAHTDSPNLRIKPVPDVTKNGYLQLGVETYGGLLDYSWLDKDLGIAGTVMVRTGEGGLPHERLVRIDRPILRIPSLAIHLNREVRTDGLKLNAQTHLPPILGLGDPDEDGPGALRNMLGAELDVEPDSILSWDLSLMDTLPPAVGGLHGEFVFAPRMDNQAMSHASLEALLQAPAAPATQVVSLYDHEEVGSASSVGAAGNMLSEVLRRIAEVEGPGAEAGGLPRSVARSYQVSADMAHGVHPNYADRHEPLHLPALNGGPVIKVNTNQRYATCAETEALFESLCLDVGAPCQKFVNRTDLACGSTIGPISAARTGIATVDVGNAMLSMHSIREMGGSRDPAWMVQVMARFLEVS